MRRREVLRLAGAAAVAGLLCPLVAQPVLADFLTGTDQSVVADIIDDSVKDILWAHRHERNDKPTRDVILDEVFRLLKQFAPKPFPSAAVMIDDSPGPIRISTYLMLKEEDPPLFRRPNILVHDDRWRGRRFVLNVFDYEYEGTISPPCQIDMTEINMVRLG